jgi:flagellar hook-length control protein FliK
MDWWHVALNIFSLTETSPSSSSNSSSKKPSSTDQFARDLAKAADARQTRQPAPKPSKPAAKSKHTADDSDDDSQSKPAAKSSSSANSNAKAQAPASSQSQDDSSSEDAAAAQANADAATVGKGRAPIRTTGKNSAAQSSAAAKAQDAAADPSADSPNQSGLNLLQLLAKSTQSDDSETAATTDTSAPTATDKSSNDGKASDDPNAIALAVFTQALAAALAGQQTPTSSAASAKAGDGTMSIAGATQLPGEDLMTVLAHDVAADAKGKSDDAAAQFNVDPTKNSATDASSTDTTAVGPNALAHLGVASHFAAQHLSNDNTTADLKAPVGSSAWQDEIGTHLTWMTQKGLETGSLRVSPEHLGPVEVNITVQNGDASVWFAANHPDTRAALEQALPRLREMFANQGMNLADAGVSRQSLSQQDRNQSRSGASQGISGVSAVSAADGASAAARINLGLVDLYA